MDDLIKFLLEIYTLEEILERLDITPERVLEILFEEGHVNYAILDYGHDGQTCIEEEEGSSSSAQHAGTGAEDQSAR